LYVWWIEQPVMGWPQLASWPLRGTLHLLYFSWRSIVATATATCRIVYPLARGTGPC
jgi:hypothetical protein